MARPGSSRRESCSCSARPAASARSPFRLRSFSARAACRRRARRGPARGASRRSEPTRPLRSTATTSGSDLRRLSTARRRRSCSTALGPAARGRARPSPVPGARIVHVGQSAGADRDARLGPRARKAAPDPRLLELRRAARRTRAGLRGRGRPRGRGPHPARRQRRFRSDRVGEAWAQAGARPRRQARARSVTPRRIAITYNRSQPRTEVDGRQPVIMPKLGAYTEDVLLTEWLVDEGEEVAAGRGRPRARDRQDDRRGRGRERRLASTGSSRPGETVPIGTTVGADRRDARGVRGARQPASAGDGERGDETQPVPRLHRPRRRDGGRAERPAPSDASAARLGAARSGPAGRRGRVRRSSRRAPARCCSELGFTLDDAREITGSGPGGRIVDRDVAAWAEARRAGRRAVVGEAGRADGRTRRSRCAAAAGRSRPAWSRASRPPPS